MIHFHPAARIGSALIVLASVLTARAQAPLLIYSNSLVNAFQDWSFSTHNLTNRSPVHSAPYSISVIATNWQAVSFEHADINTASCQALFFWVNGGPVGGQVLQVQADTNALNGPVAGTYAMAALPPN